MPRLPDPSVTRRVTVQPTVTSVFPHLLSPGKGYTLARVEWHANGFAIRDQPLRTSQIVRGNL